MTTNVTTLDKSDLSSLERAKVNRLLNSIYDLLKHPQVQKALCLVNKGQVIFEVRDGQAIEVTTTPMMRKGKEL
jgi:phage pi2 protein 07